MSDPIETGALRRVKSISRPRSQATGRRRKAEPPVEAADPGQPPQRASRDETIRPTAEKRQPDRKDEMELGRFSGRYGRDEPPKKPTGKRSADVKDEMELGRFSGRYAEERPARKAADKRPADPKDELELGRFSGRYAGERPVKKTKSKSAADGKGERKLGRFSGRYSEERSAENNADRRTADTGDVVGPKRKKSDLKKAEVKRKSAELELRIASPRDTSDDATPSRKKARRRSRSRPGKAEGWGRLAALTVLSVILVALTIATFVLLPRYETLGDPLIAHPAFEAGLADWQQEGRVAYDPNAPGNVSLESLSTDTPTFLTRDIALSSGETLLLLRAAVQGEDVQPGPEIWDQARIYLARLDSDGEPLWDEDHELFDLSGTTGVRNYSRAFSIPDDVDAVRLGIELKNATGKLTVSRLELVEAERPMTFVIMAACLLLAWGVLTLYSAFRTLKGIDSRPIRLSLGIACALSVAALMLPGALHEVWIDAIAGPLGLKNPDVDVIGHAVVFTILPFLVRLGRPSVPILLHVGVWLLIAVASEAAQLFTFDREPSVEDLVVDGMGILLGLSLAEAVRSVQRWRMA